MNRCILCGGPLGSDGRCRECGLDNTKNDKKYRLNTHNDKMTMLHHGDCEDNLNKDHGYEGFGETKARERGTAKVNSAKTSSPKNRADATAEKTEYAKYQSARKNEKKKKERRAAGTVKKKGICLTRVIRWIIILYVLQAVLAAVFGMINTADLSGDLVSGFLEEFELEQIIEEVGTSYALPEPHGFTGARRQMITAGLSVCTPKKSRRTMQNTRMTRRVRMQSIPDCSSWRKAA